MSGVINDVLQAEGWFVDGLGNGGDASLLTTSGELNELLTADGWTVGDTGSAIIGLRLTFTPPATISTASPIGLVLTTATVVNPPEGATITYSIVDGDGMATIDPNTGVVTLVDPSLAVCPLALYDETNDLVLYDETNELALIG